MKEACSQRIALVDVNNMYVSCERIFRPDLEKVPLVVLSNNDGCIVSRSAEVKAMQIAMAEPWFKVKEYAEAQGVKAFSSNYALYANISNRIMSILAEFTPYQEVYSIDESFLDFTGMPKNLTDYAQTIRQRIRQWVGVPICIGIGPSKTLAKLANAIAKKNPSWGGVCDLSALTPLEVQTCLAALPVSEVWGIGRRLTKALDKLGIKTVRDLQAVEPALMRKLFSVVVERIVLELRGISCLELEELIADKKQIISSRSFGHEVYTHDDLKEAITLYIGIAAEKLRKQHSVAKGVYVSIASSRFKTSHALYRESVLIPLPDYTDDTLMLTRFALQGLERIYKLGIGYAKAGVMLVEIISKDDMPPKLFVDDEKEIAHRASLMHTLDAINRRYGKHTLGVGVAGLNHPRDWSMRRGNKTPGYTTCWEELPIAYAD